MSGDKPVVVYTRPRDWFDCGYTSNKLGLVYVPLTGSVPRKRNGVRTGDSIGDVIRPEGLKELFDQVNRYKPDFLLHWIHIKVNLEILKRVKELSPKTRIIVGDGNQPHTVSKYVKAHKEYLDGVLLNSKDEKTKAQYYDAGFEPHQIGTLYDGIRPKDHPLLKVKMKYDCLFGGSCNKTKGEGWTFPKTKWRRDFIVAVHDQFKLALYGYPDYWPIKPIKHLSYPHYFKAIQEARIILGTNHYDLDRYYIRRTLHSGVAGRLFITRYIPNMEKDFENHKNIVWFREMDEGLELIEYYLRHGTEREAIAKEQRKHFLNNHTWKNRLEEFEQYVYRYLDKGE